MFEFIKNLIAPKVEARILIKGSIANVYALQSFVQRWGLYGRFQIISPNQTNIELQGKQPVIEKRIEELRASPMLGSQCTLQISFFEYTGKHGYFRIG